LGFWVKRRRRPRASGLIREKKPTNVERPTSNVE
jgi:hypothetical protein